MTSNPQLLQLTTPEFADSIGFALPPAPFRRVLQRSQYVRGLATSLQYGQIEESEIRSFVSELLARYKQGELFEFDVALAAVAVAMEHWTDSFADEFLIDLARIGRSEFRASFRVARECLKARYSFPKTQVRTARYPQSDRVARLPSSLMRDFAYVKHNGRDEMIAGLARYSG